MAWLWSWRELSHSLSSHLVSASLLLECWFSTLKATRSVPNVKDETYDLDQSLAFRWARGHSALTFHKTTQSLLSRPQHAPPLRSGGPSGATTSCAAAGPPLPARAGSSGSCASDVAAPAGVVTTIRSRRSLSIGDGVAGATLLSAEPGADVSLVAGAAAAAAATIDGGARCSSGAADCGGPAAGAEASACVGCSGDGGSCGTAAVRGCSGACSGAGCAGGPAAGSGEGSGSCSTTTTSGVGPAAQRGESGRPAFAFGMCAAHDAAALWVLLAPSSCSSASSSAMLSPRLRRRTNTSCEPTTVVPNVRTATAVVTANARASRQTGPGAAMRQRGTSRRLVCVARGLGRGRLRLKPLDLLKHRLRHWFLLVVEELVVRRRRRQRFRAAVRHDTKWRTGGALWSPSGSNGHENRHAFLQRLL